MEISVNVIGQKLKIATNLKCFISGSQQFVKFIFNMDDSWDNLRTFAQFRQNDVAYNQYLDANNSVYLPREIGAGACTLILYGTGGNVRATTNYLTLTIDENILVTNAQSTEITQSLYEQLVNSVTTTTNRLQDRVSNVENVIQGLAGGAPIVVSSASAMTDTDQIYVLSTDGYWYYYDGSAWVAGGVYGGVPTDTTLTQADMPADAKAVGDKIVDLEEDLSRTENDMEYALIIEETESGHVHEGLSDIASVLIEKDEYSFGSPVLYSEKNVLKEVETSGTANDLSYAVNGTCVKLNGTSGSDIETNHNIYRELQTHYSPGDTIKVLLRSSDVLSNVFSYLRVLVETNGSNYYTSLTTPLALSNNDYVWTYTINGRITRVSLQVKIPEGVTANDMRIWFAILPGGCEAIDTEIDFTEINSYEYYNNALNDWTTVESGQYSTKVSCKKSTKDYVDFHIPDIDFDTEVWSREYYLSPEMYGAIGNGISDDYAAVQACLNAVKTSPYKCVRGYGTYKISQGIEIQGRELDVYLHRIIYSGNDAAVTIHAMSSSFRFNAIWANAGGENAVGMRCSTLEESGLVNGLNSCKIECDYIYAKGNALELISTSGVNDLYYNVFRIGRMSSVNQNIIYVNGGAISEIDLYLKHLSARNGWLLYNANASGYVGNNIRLHEACLEQLVKFGIYNGNSVHLINARTEEFMNHGGETDDRQGKIWVFNGVTPFDFSSDENTNVSFYAIDVSNARSFEETVEFVRADQTTTLSYQLYDMYYGADKTKGICKKCQTFGNSPHPFGTPRFMYGGRGEIIVYYNNKAFKPDSEVYYKITSATFSTEPDYENRVFITPTYFDIDVPLATINLDPSYCCVALNEFSVQQYADKKAIIYDKHGDLLFDGSSKDAGVYKFTCNYRGLTQEEVDYMRGRSTGVGIEYFGNVYTGSNETWTITKLEDAS